VEYSTTPDGPLIHLYGRNSAGIASCLIVTGFRPYFYIAAADLTQTPLPPITSLEEKTSYRSIHGEVLRRLYTGKPTDVRELRSRFHHFEADIPFTTRFMIDCGLTEAVAAPSSPCEYSEIRPIKMDAPVRTCIIDIECDDSRGFPDSGRDPVLCICAWDSFTQKSTTFFLDLEGSLAKALTTSPGIRGKHCFDPAFHTILTYPNEEKMFLGFSAFIHDTDPDILSGWNFTDFDYSYILGRMAACGIPEGKLARLPGQTERSAVRGRSVFDLLAAYRKMQPSLRSSYRLDAVAEAEVGETKVRYRGRIIDLWKDDPLLLVEYNHQDVALCVAINEKNRIVEFYREIARYVGCPLDRTLASSSIIDIYLLRKAYNRYVLPSKGNADAEEFEGATVFEASHGLKENVIVLDLKSLYPMAMMTINASPETKDPEGELRAPNGVRFKKQPDGLARSIISDLLKERDEKKRARNLHPFGSQEYVLFDLQQNVLKVIMNTYYGVSGFPRFRLYDREIGSAVTAVGRAIIEHTRRVIEEMGYRVIYGDTDSCMVTLPGHDIPAMIAVAGVIEERLNASYNEFAARELNAASHFFSIKFEKIYQRFFQSGRKKRYAGHLIWKEGKVVDEIDIVGFETRRSDTPGIARDAQRQVMEMILKGEDFPAVKRYLGGIIRDYRSGKFSLDEIGIPGGIGKQLDSYANVDAHVRGAKYANDNLGTEFAKGSKPKRVYIKSVQGKYPKTDVLCFEYGDQVPPEFVIDRELMLTKTIRQPISRIIEALGWQWDDIDPTRTTLSQFGF
jgi:DNA polymerase I